MASSSSPVHFGRRYFGEGLPFFFLTGENPAMAREEVMAVLGKRDWVPYPVSITGRILVVSSRREREFGDVMAYIKKQTKRLVLTHFSCLTLAAGKQEDVQNGHFSKNLETSLSRSGNLVTSSSRTFAIRVHRIGTSETEKAGRPSDHQPLASDIGNVIKNSTGWSVDLGVPQITIDIILEGEDIFLGLRLAESTRKAVLLRRSRKRTFSHASSMNSLLLHAMLNISAAQTGNRIADPFAGSGGFLIEAGTLGMTGIGTELDKRMMWGARLNIQNCRHPTSLVWGDARHPPFRKAAFDAMVTDPPYGGAASTKGAPLSSLIADTLREWRYIVKGRTVVCTPQNFNIEEIAKPLGYSIEAGPFLWRVHRSLTRKIVVFEARAPTP